jgi:uroporphyrinogen-III synthase
MTLRGRVVLVTRPIEQAASLVELLRARGAEAIPAPTIEIEQPTPGGPLDDAIRRAAAGGFAWVVFTSAAGVRAWWGRAKILGAGPPDASAAAIGDATAEALRATGIEADLVPPTFTTAALGEAFPEGTGAVLLARADLATGELESVLRDKGWATERVDAYRVRAADRLPEPAIKALRSRRAEVVTFTSPSTVEGFVRLAGTPSEPLVVCIGPVTAEAARALGFEVAAIADPHTERGLVRAVSSLFG